MSEQGRPPRRQGPGSAAGRADLRTTRLNQREHDAGLREKRLDERGHDADQREALADDREALANDRENRANLREKQLDERELSLGDLRQRLARTIQRTHALLAADLSPGGWDRSRGSSQGRLAEGGHDLAESERLPAILAGVRQQVEQSQTLCRQAASVIGSLAATAERIARQHDQMAAVSTKHAERYRRLADDARAAAQRARAILGKQR